MSTLRHYFRLSIDSDQGREALRRNCTKLTLQILALHLVRAAVTQLVQYHFSQSGTGGPSFALSSSRRRCSCARSAGSGACATNLSNRSLFCVIIQCSRAIFGIAQTPTKPSLSISNGVCGETQCGYCLIRLGEGVCKAHRCGINVRFGSEAAIRGSPKSKA